ncbi:MAG TPA: hemerythrin domain-containing protein [Candidatus Paceibacterota bacterium]|nr:hemerythrin domain-containing protein [Candidatus Pacearchaeota archaeon]HRZ50380.1 hemerythrin domain-containing protein [Candidatus Paceibacterota bacterium]HSA36101.1 hemerythrin domain-containing protein [Candidatus Paceibacterota bacterium]
MRPIAELIQDHGPAKMALRVLEKICEKIDNGEEVNKEEADQVVYFIREFVDKCHHGKEEGQLFAVIKRNSNIRDNGLVDDLIKEHESGRGFVKNMADALKAGDMEKFKRNSLDYVKLLDQHIFKENTVLFPMAERALNNEEQKELEEGFLQIEREVIGKELHDKLHNLIHELRESYS